jgi:hypothetical protein
MKKEAHMITKLKITLAVIVLTFTFTSFTWAALSIDSVYPNVGKVGEDLSVTIRGNGFDKNTRVSVSQDTGNRRLIIGSVDTPGLAQAVAVVGHTAYIADFISLQIIDVSDPANPVIIGSVETPGFPISVTVVGQTAYVADRISGLQIIDVSNPANPVIIGSVDTPGSGYANDVTVVGQTAYVADRDIGLWIIDVSDSANPVITGSMDTPGEANAVMVLGQTAYVADGISGLQVIDVSDPANPVITGSVDTPGEANAVMILGQTAYVADGISGLQVIDVSDPANPVITGSVNTGLAMAMAVTILGQTAYMANWNSGLQVIDVSDPANPFILGSVETPGQACAVTVVGQTAYIADWNSGLQVINVSDPANPIITGSVDTPGEANAVTVIGQTAYLADGDSGLQVIDVSDPANPVIIGSVDTPGYAKDVTVVGQTAYVADWKSCLQVIDVSDPSNPVIMGSVDTQNDARTVTVIGQTAYVAHWDSGLQIIDVSDPADPVIIGSVDTPDSAQGVTVVGQTAYVSDGDGGLWIIDVSDPANPVIIGSVDTPSVAWDFTVVGQTAYVVDGDSGLSIVPVPMEITPVNVISSTELRVTLPGPVIAGHYNLRVVNRSASDELFGAVSFLSEGDYQNLRQKKAIIAAGGTGDPSDRLSIPTRTCTNLAYLSLLSQGYIRENIQFLGPYAAMDVDGDGKLNDVDAPCTTATLSAAITGWAADASELIVYLADHGGDGTFFASAGDIVRASQLDAWLDTAQNTIPGKVILIYDACYSGSFLPLMTPPAGKERIVITSSTEDEPAWFMIDGVLSFSYQFWASVFVNANLYESFVTAKNMMAHDQTGLLDANADGVQTKEDVTLVRNFVIGRGRVAASTPPLIGSISEEQALSGSHNATLRASDITALNKIEAVWAVIVPPSFENGTNTEVTSLDTIELTDPDQDGIYTGAYDRFTQPGTYRITIHAKDDKGQISLPKTTTVVQQHGQPGDINGDGAVDLTDAVIGLKLCAGITTVPVNNPDADVNNDGCIGMPEVLYIMRKAGGS